MFLFLPHLSYAAWLSGSPTWVPNDADCTIRALAYEYGRKLLPRRRTFKSLYDALQLQHCQIRKPPAMEEWLPPERSMESFKNIIYVAEDGDDADLGSFHAPKKSLSGALLHLQIVGPSPILGKPTIAFKKGKHFIKDTVRITPAEYPRGMNIMNEGGAHATLTGAFKLELGKDAWSVVEQDFGFRQYAGWSNIPPGASADLDTNSAKHTLVGDFPSYAACLAAVEKTELGHALNSFTWFHPDADPKRAKKCYMVLAPFGFQPIPDGHATSGRSMKLNLWKAKVPADVPPLVSLASHEPPFQGLRLDGRRAIRAKYPDGAPERTSDWFVANTTGPGGAGDQGYYTHGFISRDTKWRPPVPTQEATTFTIKGEDWPDVGWPVASPGNHTGSSGMGQRGAFFIAQGGACTKATPSAGYTCAPNPRGTTVFQAPSGLDAVSTVLPHFRNYTKVVENQAVINAWRGGDRAHTWQFLIATLDEDGVTFSEKTGGHQGATGNVNGAQWWIENVLQECDSADEFYYDAQAQELYYNFNSTSRNFTPTGHEVWEVPYTNALIEVSAPDVSISGLEFQDTDITYFKPHGFPSGGDWALERTAAIVFRDGAHNGVVENCLLRQLDGNGIMLFGATYDCIIRNNEVASIGGSALITWGKTSDCLDAKCNQTLTKGTNMGPDGRDMQVPWRTIIQGNVFREIGIWQKQSAFYFQAISAETLLSNNIFFNGPRAAVNFNDGFAGGDKLVGNLLLNAVRESSAHGTLNSWDRMPFINAMRGYASIESLPRQINKNFILGTYSAEACMNSDDGSSFYDVSGNVFAYGTNAYVAHLGHDNKHVSNIYLFPHDAFMGTEKEDENSGENGAFVNNDIVIADEHGYPSDCDAPYHFQVSGNRVYTPSGKLAGVCGKQSFEEYQETGHDQSTTTSQWPSSPEIRQMVSRLLDFATNSTTQIIIM